MTKSVCFLVLLAALFVSGKPAPNEPLKLGAYYFDGWTGKTYHISEKLTTSFPEREPKWGWITSTPAIMEDQIDLANEAGIDFFNFCWYNDKDAPVGELGADPKNNALELFRNAKNRKKLEFSILIVNNGQYAINPDNWDSMCKYWVEIFKSDNYLQANGKPLLTFFDMPSLVKSFGSTNEVVAKFNDLKKLAVREGLPGVTIAAVFGSKPASVQMAIKCKIDIITGYNYASYGLASKQDTIIPINNMRSTEENVWDQILSQWDKPIIPAITLNWDKRPWNKSSSVSRRFSGFSGESVKESIISYKHWMANNQNHLCKENIAIVYAWNEYGEGAWLTPTKASKNTLLEGLKAGLNEK